MADQDLQSANEYYITRRMALATLSTSLLTKVRFGPFTTLVIEEFLAESTTSIVACWHLLQGYGIATVEHTLPEYLPLLTTLIKQFPSYKQRASYLAAHAYILMGLVSLHKFNLQTRVAYCRKAVEYARASGDQTLLVIALTHLGGPLGDIGQRSQMVHTYQEATSYVDGILPAVHMAVGQWQGESPSWSWQLAWSA